MCDQDATNSLFFFFKSYLIQLCLIGWSCINIYNYNFDLALFYNMFCILLFTLLFSILVFTSILLSSYTFVNILQVSVKF